jgi:hypothetical protein
MWIVLAASHDRAARDLTAAFPASTRLVTPDAIGPEGWTLEVGNGDGASCDATHRVDGVLTRLPGVGPGDLPGVRAEDREYAAAELDAFLLAWLDACPAPVLNRPTPGSLNGPAWPSFAWSLAAHRAGLGTAADPDGQAAAAITVVGDRVLGDDGVDAGVVEGVRRLARSAGTPLLEVALDGLGPEAAFVGASVCPELHPQLVDSLADICGWTR